jgi:FkbM family methyltransferase
VVDAGANIGMITTLAARLVGSTGRVVACEPNPDCCRRIEEVVRTNRLAGVEVHQCALGDERGETELSVPEIHSGGGFLIPVEESANNDGHRVQVRVATGDEVLGEELPKVDAVKIDVEGYETHVVRGLHGTLSAWKPLVIAEIMEGHLRRAGSSGEELFGLMNTHGYSALAVGTDKRTWLLRPRLTLRPVQGPRDVPHGTNVAWIDPGGGVMERVNRFLVG